MAAQPIDRETVTDLVRAATAAPSMHNAQPWRFRFHSAGRELDLRADLDRAMPHTDPDQRALHIGCGAALFNLRVAVAEKGWGAAVRLFPDAADAQLLARVRLAPGEPHDPALAGLSDAIGRRHTSRRPFTDKPVPAAVEGELCAAARSEGAQLIFVDEWHREALLDQVKDAEGRDRAEPDRTEDVRRWTRTGAAEATDGVPEYAFGPRVRTGRAPVRDFAGRGTDPGRPAVAFENAPHLAVLGTAEDRRDDWLRAGQALERVLLLATLDGLATSLTAHALEWRDLRELARDPSSSMGFVHMVLRLGYGPSGTATPRNPVGQVLEID
ncbi:Acg family FMN-binding oxidoreductase [Streptomyces boluensis]|uniref:Nitroreductase n=1 Tax=Streptomyces boluensis TaxID=1775135 RepID=A0A964XNU2_9ACTN|nr:nitroreductase family protein [Streptomyces boluensis]NBE54546.1 nitroreductase [Streptomyces boluensis]